MSYKLGFVSKNTGRVLVVGEFFEVVRFYVRHKVWQVRKDVKVSLVRVVGTPRGRHIHTHSDGGLVPVR